MPPAPPIFLIHNGQLTVTFLLCACVGRRGLYFFYFTLFLSFTSEPSSVIFSSLARKARWRAPMWIVHLIYS